VERARCEKLVLELLDGSGAERLGGRLRPHGPTRIREPEGTALGSAESESVEAGVRRLLRMLAALEEAIIRLESSGDPDVDRVVGRLRGLQDGIATALRLNDSRGRHTVARKRRA
jgi:hypothetical protein